MAEVKNDIELDENIELNIEDKIKELKALGYIQEGNIHNGYIEDMFDRKDDWIEIDNLIAIYQKQFKPEYTNNKKIKEESQVASEELLFRFNPMFKKYLFLLKTGNITFSNEEQKSFVKLFIDEPRLAFALYQKYIHKTLRDKIEERFAFIVKTYGTRTEEEIMGDLHIAFLILARRYVKKDRSFCCYLYNAFRYEVARYIKKQIKEVSNISYKLVDFNEEKVTRLAMKGLVQDSHKYEINFEDIICENSDGLPDLSWISGECCGEAFETLTPEERKILIKYYLEDYSDARIAEELGCHINTCNAKRRKALFKIADKLNVSRDTIIRTRKVNN